jgi:hypothetical protein
MKLLSNILAPVSCVTVVQGTKLLGERFFNSKKEKKEKNSRH